MPSINDYEDLNREFGDIDIDGDGTGNNVESENDPAGKSFIFRDLTLTVNGDSCSLNEPISIYRGDRGIVFRIKIVSYKYKFLKGIKTPEEINTVEEYGIKGVTACVLKPNGEYVDPSALLTFVESDTVLFVISRDWVDELEEEGQHTVQFHLYGQYPIDQRLTIPTFNFNVKKPICAGEFCDKIFEDGNPAQIDSAIVGLSTLSLLTGYNYTDDLPNGLYDDIRWNTGDYITADRMNRMEDAIDYAIGELVNIYRKAEHDQDITELSSELLRLSEELSKVSLDTINQSITDLETKHNEDIANLESKHNEDIATVNQSIDELGNAQDEYAQTINLALDTLTNANTAVTTHISGIDKKINTLQTDVGTNTQSIQSLESSISEVNSDIEELTYKLENTLPADENTINELKELHINDMNTINSTIDAIEDKHEQDITAVYNALSEASFEIIYNSETPPDDTTALWIVDDDSTVGEVVTSESVNRIEIVTEYPTNPEENVLYIKVTSGD